MDVVPVVLFGGKTGTLVSDAWFLGGRGKGVGECGFGHSDLLVQYSRTVGRSSGCNQLGRSLANYPGCALVRGSLAMSKSMIEHLVDLVEGHDIYPVIAKSFAWEEAREAFEALSNQDGVGKIVIEFEL